MAIALVACIAGACSRGGEANPAPVAARTTPLGPDTPLNLARPDEARVKLDLSASREALRLYQQVNGKFPEGLQELDLRLNYPGDLDYSAPSGAVRSRTYPQF